ncbi:uncharacterized protein B0P05DRAFT_551854, partial [Gilbertella persicaria]|uniref:uncharacterized protein n=1 Tax=Gilbertella persicaria TaxID=101096 RepID=UPI00221FA078
MTQKFFIIIINRRLYLSSNILSFFLYLLFNMATLFFDNPYASPEQIKLNDFEPKPSSHADFDDFFVALDALDAPIAKYAKSADNWQFVVNQMRQQMFNSSKTNYGSPETFFLQKARQSDPLYANSMAHTMRASSFCTLNTAGSDRDADPLAYRRFRSEHLLMRMLHCRDSDWSQVSLMRLSKGIFVHQKWQSSKPQSSPTLSAIEDTLYQFNDSTEAPIDTFQFDNAFHMMNSLTSSCYDMFVPYSYTFGARYTNPYGNAHDLVIRGKLPLWCQTLFLSTCLKQATPVQPHVALFGLFPFAPQVAVTFKPLTEEYEHAISPELTLLYERFTLEHYDPLIDIDQDEYECLWAQKKKDILQNILVCDIPDDLAKFLNNMAALWAANQGLMI